ncbi:MAG: hypothetical protein N4J56_005053 [Chroococcidiopsis sp. SAG 2025]|nr:hypothetical protein [Chroococcidiopsis sp. SAG 2025]
MADDRNQQQMNNEEEILTNRQGHPVTDNQNVRTVGDRST